MVFERLRSACLIGACLLAAGGAAADETPSATGASPLADSLIDLFPGYFYQWPRERFDRAYGPRASDHPGYALRAWRARFHYSYRDGTWRR